MNLPHQMKRQAGVVLVISLIMLLLLTLIGITASNVTGLEEKMAGNTRDENLAFQAAESALRAGEALVRVNPPAFSVAANGSCTAAGFCTSTGGSGLYTLISAVPSTISETTGFWYKLDWNYGCTSDPTHCPYAIYNGGTLSNVTTSPKYIIEELPTTTSSSTTNSGGSKEVGVAGSSQGVAWYRITARATGGSDNTVVILQSIYKR